MHFKTQITALLKNVTHQHPLFVNNSNNNHYFTNFSTNYRSVSIIDQLNSITICLINNKIKDGDLANSEIAPLTRLQTCHIFWEI